MSERLPQVSIGLPVFNGENYLGEALDSLLAQTFTDFELIISDNASTDGTQSICESVAKADSRVRYFRADKNHGASWNHQFVIDKARAPLFKLAAHDDIVLPTMLEKCVAALQRNPQPVLAYTQTMMIRADQDSMSLYQDAANLASPNPAERFGDLICEAPPAFPIFGVVRLHALKSIPGFDPYKASDRVVVSRLALMSHFLRIDEPLFKYRWHDSNASNLMATGNGFYTWWDPNKGHGRVYPETRLAWEHLRSIFLVRLSLRQRRACLREWWHWLTSKRQRIRLELRQLWSGDELPAYPPKSMLDLVLQRQQRSAYKAKHYAKPS